MKLILTKQQAKTLLQNIPKGKAIRISVSDAENILFNDEKKKKK